jgi:hypothetical protein
MQFRPTHRGHDCFNRGLNRKDLCIDRKIVQCWFPPVRTGHLLDSPARSPVVAAHCLHPLTRISVLSYRRHWWILHEAVGPDVSRRHDKNAKGMSNSLKKEMATASHEYRVVRIVRRSYIE